MLIVASLTFIYLLAWSLFLLFKWRQGRFSLGLLLLAIVVVTGLLMTTLSYVKSYQDWQISIFALGFMVLGILPQYYEFQHKQPLSLKWHLVQFTFHAGLIFLLYMVSQF